MISQVNSSVAHGLYAKASENKTNNVGTQNAKGSTSRVEELKALINSGEYKVDLSAVAKKMADELL